MVIYDEKSVAEQMHNTQSFIKKFCADELTIYAKWLKYNEIIKRKGEYVFDFPDEELDEIDSIVEAGIIDFSSKHYGAFNYNIDYKTIDKAMENSRKLKLRLPLPVSITKNEWNTILNVDNENYRRALLIMLIDAKYNRYHNASLRKDVVIDDSTVFYSYLSESDIFGYMNVKIPKAEKPFFFCDLMNNTGLCNITDGKHNTVYVNFVDVDINSEILDDITDYNHLHLYYEKFLNPESIGVCRYCGALFKQNKKRTAQYCYLHRNHKSKQYGVCIDCGKSFVLAPNKVRCDICQNNKKRIDTKYRVKKHRDNVTQLIQD